MSQSAKMPTNQSIVSIHTAGTDEPVATATLTEYLKTQLGRNNSTYIAYVENDEVCICNIETEEIQIIPEPEGLVQMFFLDGHSLLLSGAEELQVYDVELQAYTKTFPKINDEYGIVRINGDYMIWVRTDDIVIYDFKTTEIVKHIWIEDHNYDEITMYSHDTYVKAWQKALTLYNFIEEKERVYELGDNYALCAEVLSKEKLFAAGRNMLIVDVESGDVRRVDIDLNILHSRKLDDKRLILAYEVLEPKENYSEYYMHCKIWNIETEKLDTKWFAVKHGYSPPFSVKGDMLVCYDAECQIQIVDLKTMEVIKKFNGEFDTDIQVVISK
jgi:hypothetical protein